MKKTLAILTALVLAIAAEAQTLKINTASNSYAFQASEMTESNPGIFANGTTLTINNTVINLADITSAEVTSSTDTSSDVEANTVNIVYSGTTATVTMADNVKDYVTATVSGAHVTISQTNTDAIDGDEITYVLSGSSSDGELALDGSYKCTVSLAGVTLTNPSGAAINITNKKRIQLSAKKGTENTLTDGADGSQKACIYSKGQIQLQGNGTLNVAGNTKHAIKSASYISVKNLTLNITAAVSDGINCEEYFLMKSGTVTISGVGDDGIQCDLGGTTTTGETTDHEDEDTGNIYFEGGTLNATVTAAATKGMKADGDVRISGGTVTIKSTGSATWDTDDSEVKGSKCISADGNVNISGGTVTLTATGSGAKGIKADGTLAISDGTVTVKTSGQIAYCQSTTSTTIKTTTSADTTSKLDDALKTSPKGIKSTGAMTISGGTISVTASYHEAIETKSTLDISGGNIYAQSNDDGINASSTLTISGGNIMSYSTGNDGIDANGNLYIKGGNVFAIAASGAEVGLDANTESGYKLYISGGNVVAIGGFESGASISGGTAKSASYSKSTWYGLTNGSTAAFAFKVPSGNSMGSSMAIYTTGTPALSSGVSGSGTALWDGNGYSSFSGGNSVSLSDYSSGGGTPGGGGPGGNTPGDGNNPGGGSNPGGRH